MKSFFSRHCDVAIQTKTRSLRSFLTLAMMCMVIVIITVPNTVSAEFNVQDCKDKIASCYDPIFGQCGLGSYTSTEVLADLLSKCEAKNDTIKDLGVLCANAEVGFKNKNAECTTIANIIQSNITDPAGLDSCKTIVNACFGKIFSCGADNEIINDAAKISIESACNSDVTKKQALKNCQNFIGKPNENECKQIISSITVSGVDIFVAASPASPTAPTEQVGNTGSPPDDVSISLSNPLGTTDVQGFIGKIISIGLGFVGALALLAFMYGGFMWMTSRGKQEMISKGSKTMLWATFGLILVFISYSLIQFVIDALGAQ